MCEDVSPEMTPKRPKLTDEAEHKKLGKLSKFRISKVTRKSLKSECQYALRKLFTLVLQVEASNTCSPFNTLLMIMSMMARM